MVSTENHNSSIILRSYKSYLGLVAAQRQDLAIQTLHTAQETPSLRINDICTAVSENINLFADDTSLYVTDRSAALLPDHLQRAIDGVSTWFSTWLLSVNTLKSAVIVLRSAKMPPVPLDVSIDGQMLPQVSTHRHLGLVVDEHLT